MKGIIFLTVLVCLFLVNPVQAQDSIKVIEAETTAVAESGQLRVKLAVESNFPKKTPARIRVRILDANDRIITESNIAENLVRGRNDLALKLPLLAENKVEKLMWHRLGYTVEAAGKAAAGIVSLSEIMPELFALRVAAADKIHAGMTYPARVRAFHPVKYTPVAGVEINAKLTIDLETEDDDDELIIKARGRTDAEGLAVLEFQIPEDVKFSDDESGEIEITGRKNGLTNDADESLETGGNRAFVYFTTDKPLYQPAQKIFVRALVLRKNAADEGMTVAAEREFEFSIKDEDETVLFRQKVTTSRFGIASIEWQIPPNAKLGLYRVEADSADETLGAARTFFKVSRYELPNFIVETKADKDFYLPDQQRAEVTVDALYLFGKPVAGGKVRVVRESARAWNYREQKWDVQEEAVYEGETNADGKYKAVIDLGEAHENLRKDENDKFTDLKFTAYFTDLSTNRTEQRRFDLRVTREPIHIYLNKGKGGDNNPKIPLVLYVTTYSADGKPIACEVEVTGKYEDETTEKPLARLKTNTLGAGRAEFFAPKREDGIYEDDLDFRVVARDAENRVGTEKFAYAIDEDEKQIVVRTDKTIYGTGEPLKIEILSTEADETVFVDVLKNASVIAARRVKLKNGRAELRIPYNPNFKSFLTVSAFFDDDGEAVEDARRVVYATPRNLRVKAETNKEVFRPNEEAALKFNVSTADKKTSEAALGVIVLDRAVEERARLDANFSGVDIFQNFGNLFAENKWDEIDMKTVTPETQLQAEMKFTNFSFENNFFESGNPKNLNYIFAEKIKKQFENVQKVLWERYRQTSEHPTDEDSLRKILSQNGIDFDALRDPWGNKYRAYVYIDREYDALYIWSNGANKVYDREFPKAGTDDFTVLELKFNYFTPTGLKISEAVSEYVRKTGKFVRDIETWRAALTAKDIAPDELKDRWGEPYRPEFGAWGRNLTITLRSSGADKKFVENSYEDFVVWTVQTDYFASDEAQIGAILSKFTTEKQTFPQTEAELKTILRDGGLDFDALRDVWNRPYYLEYEARTQFADKVIIENAARQGEAVRETLTITPVTRQVGVWQIRSLGQNGVKDDNSWEDVRVSSFAGIISEQTKDDAKPKLVVPKAVFANGRSAIYGIVTDASKAVVTDAQVIITNSATQTAVETKTNADGLFLQTGLAAGKYSVRVNAAGFKSSLVNEIKLEREKIAEINFTLEAGGISEVVTVSADQSVTVDTTDTKIATNVVSGLMIQEFSLNGQRFSSFLMIAPGVGVVTRSGGFQIDGASGSENVFVIDGQEVTNFRSGVLNKQNKQSELVEENPNSTPRLREYFPETLLFIPELVTQKNGQVAIKFRLADNITTWKIYAIASDTSGRIGVTSKEIKAFQPFFVDLDPPRILTEGDEIFLPTQVRNYTETAQKVRVEMAQGDWFGFLGARMQEIEILPNATQNAVFGFKATAPVTDGKQKVSALAEKDSDAIEKPVTVRPNGEEIVRTESRLFTGLGEFNIDFPQNALAKTPKAELKIYPNLMAHITESVEGLLQRPYGCGEQTISSTYPNLMILKFTQPRSEIRNPKSETDPAADLTRTNVAPTPLEQKAKRYLQKGYERLLGYQSADGGFSYWGGKSESDLALTAYGVRFLADAKGFLEVDPKVIENARNYLTKQQRADGSWTRKYNWETTEDARRTKLLTTYIARTLSMIKTDRAVLDKALSYLKTRNAEIDEPYTLALFGLASLDAGNIDEARETAQKLEKMAVTEGDRVYWNLETNTPFYGWGTAGRIETTALVLQLLLKTEDQNPKTKDLISRATMFLLKSKDRYGVWYSTQTTINVLDAFLASLSKGQNQTMMVSLNGEKLKEFAVTADQIEPFILDLSDKLASVNRLEITSSDNSRIMSQIVKTHYIDWKDSERANRNVNDSRAVRLDYVCDKLAAKIMETVTCSVEAERVGFRGYGMLLAEIGLPPGADVSRESLDKALEAEPSLSRYDILPDRIIIYLSAKAGGSKFNFSFKPRYAINAQTPASVLYDYYNEEARAVVTPLKFAVR